MNDIYSPDPPNASGMNVITFPFTLETAWDRYQALMLEAAEKPWLFDDSIHQASRQNAHKAFVRLYTMEAARAG